VFKSGFIGIIGRPNVGKSTLLNGIIGERIAIATHKPQTTRNRIMGIKNLGEPTPGQMTFIDTPGIHHAKTPLNKAMVETATKTIGGVDMLLLLVEAAKAPHRDDLAITESLKDSHRAVILVINKIDLAKKELLLPLMSSFSDLYPFSKIIPISALKKFGIEQLINEIWKLLPEGPPYFPEEAMTDRTERFIAAEIIREKITLRLHQEIPYVTAVVVDVFKEDGVKNMLHISATINVEKDSQKGIIIGKGGAMLREIGTKARRDMENFFATKVFLKLFVRVAKDWTHDPKMLKEFGYLEKM
jgi:GTP-binding protein Era